MTFYNEEAYILEFNNLFTTDNEAMCCVNWQLSSSKFCNLEEPQYI
jgi:hypothetical protein